MGWFSTNYQKVGAGNPTERLESEDVKAQRRREEANARSAAKARDDRIRQWNKDVARARAEIVRLEAIPEHKRNARHLRQAKKRLRDLQRDHG